MNIHEYIYTDFIRRMCATFRSSELMIFIYEGLRFNSSLFIITSNFNFICTKEAWTYSTSASQFKYDEVEP